MAYGQEAVDKAVAKGMQDSFSGPAFPHPGREGPQGSFVHEQEGMTLRDWFAGMAITG